MTKIIVNIFNSDSGQDELQCTIRAEHSGRRKFVKDWLKASDEAAMKWPGVWQVNDIERELKRLGWKLRRVKTVVVAY